VTDVTNGESQDAVALPTADEQLLRELTERARTRGLKLAGEGGLLGKLTKMVVDGALEGVLRSMSVAIADRCPAPMMRPFSQCRACRRLCAAAGR
jgi:hypothetical protein